MEEFARKYLELLNGPLKGLNLTRITEFNDFYQKQIVDSILPTVESDIFKDLIDEHDLVLDVGFGGGFPILPLAKLYPEKKFIGFEARRKKSEAVNFIAKELGFNNVQTFHQRLEDVVFNTDCLLTFKAVGPMAELMSKINVSKPKRIDAFFYKGPNLFELENLEDIPESWESLGFEDVELEGVQGRTFASFRLADVPRGTNFKKQLVNLTDFI